MKYRKWVGAVSMSCSEACSGKGMTILCLTEADIHLLNFRQATKVSSACKITRPYINIYTGPFFLNYTSISKKCFCDPGEQFLLHFFSHIYFFAASCSITLVIYKSKKKSVHRPDITNDIFPFSFTDLLPETITNGMNQAQRKY